jgi:hypothetical protein
MFGFLNPAILMAGITAAAPPYAELSKLEKQLTDKRN